MKTPAAILQRLLASRLEHETRVVTLVHSHCLLVLQPAL